MAQTGTRADAESAEDHALVQDLRALRKLAEQSHRRAATADGSMLRAIMGKREALLDAIRGRVATKDEPPDPPETTGFARELELTARDKEEIAQTVKEIAVLDSEVERILRTRADELGAEIQKLKAGKKSRECYKQWT